MYKIQADNILLRRRKSQISGRQNSHSPPDIPNIFYLGLKASSSLEFSVMSDLSHRVPVKNTKRGCNLPCCNKNVHKLCVVKAE